uniref:PiggyBac transposable element-derived protein domain-containing protein n=1 Tax=Glossina austeni TaxID=7395 RepID=A0A1A9VHP0_GLOAU
MEVFKNICMFSKKPKYEESVLVSTYFYSDRQPVKMSKGRTVLAYLENATSVSLECSDVESELYDSDGEFLDRQNDSQGSDEEILDEEHIDRSSDSDYEKIANKRTRRCMRFPSSSEDEGGSNVPNHETESGLDGTIWTRIEEGGVAGRLPVHSAFKEVHGPTAYAKRSIMNGNLSSAFLLLMDNNILEHIRICTELEDSNFGEKLDNYASKMEGISCNIVRS